MPNDSLKSPPLLTAGTLLAAMLSFVAVIGLFVARDHEAVTHEQEAAQRIAAQYGRRLEENLQNALSATYALAAVVRENRGVPKGFDRLAEELLAVYPALQTLQLAPEGIIRHIHPLAGHEKALGHNLLEDPQRNKEAFAAVRSRRLTLAGPFTLKQGGVAVIGRLPVYLPDGSGGDRFWGFATSLIPTADLVHAANLHELQAHGFSFALWRAHPDTGERQTIDASPLAPSGQTVTIAVSVPNGLWHLELSPQQGWQGLSRSDWVFAFIVATLVATLAFMALRWPARLSAEVMRKTRALQAGEDKFRTVADFTHDWEYWIGGDGRIVYMTPSAERLTGYPAIAFQNDPEMLATIVHEEDRALWDAHIAAGFTAAPGELSSELEFRIRRRDGEVRWLSHVCQPVFAPDGTSRGRRASNRDITARKTIESALSDQLVFKRALLDAQADAEIGLLVVTDGCITYANPAVARIYRRPADAIRPGDAFLSLVHADDRAAIEDHYRRCLRGDKLENRYRFRLSRDDGSSGTIELSLALIPPTDGTPSVLCMLVDTTERARFEAELLAAKQAAESANQAKSAFLANMSHELRTPMHAILSFASLGESRAHSAPPETLERFFNRIRLSGDRLMALLNDLLDLAKLEAGRLEFEFATSDLRALAANVLADFESLAAGKALQLELRVDAENTVATVDAARITQVLNNLLSNAIKFTPAEGRIAVEVAETQLVGPDHQPPQPAIAIAVRDSGIGIPEDELEAVFDEFVQSSVTRNGAGGTGLGLAICREIAGAHGGTIVARNNPEGGATLTLTVPRHATPTLLEAAA